MDDFFCDFCGMAKDNRRYHRLNGDCIPQGSMTVAYLYAVLDELMKEDMGHVPVLVSVDSPGVPAQRATVLCSEGATTIRGALSVTIHP